MADLNNHHHEAPVNPEEQEQEEQEEEEGQEQEQGGGEDDPLRHLPPYVMARVSVLNALNEDRDRIMKNYVVERAALEKKYEALLQPLYQERAAVVKGEQDREILSNTSKDDPTRQPQIGEEMASGIPGFWASTLARMETVNDLISEADVDCLNHLVDIQCIHRNDGQGFQLQFHFEDNDYFSNKVLTKDYHVPDLLLSDDPLVVNVTGTTIEWKTPERNLMFRDVTKRQRGKGKNTGQVRSINTTEEKRSFFHWFRPPILDEDFDDLGEQFEGHYDFLIAQTFRLRVIPKAILCFRGEITDQDLEGMIADAV